MANEREAQQNQAPAAAPEAASPSAEGGPSPLVQRKVALRLSRKQSGSGAVAGGAADAVAAAGSSSGKPLPSGLRGNFESSLGTDLSGVRVHDGPESAAAASAVSARAFTVGSDIHFGAGQYDASSRSGQHLLAHEVAHTAQQGGRSVGLQTKLEVSEPNDGYEREADTAADAMVRGEQAEVSSAPPMLAGSWLGDAWDSVKEGVSDAWDGAKKVGGQMVKGAKRTWNDAKAVGNKVWGGIKSTGQKVWGGIKHLAHEAEEQIDEWITEAGEIIRALGHERDGIVISAVPAKRGAPALPVGTFVHIKGIKKDRTLKVHAYSGIDKDVEMPHASFRAEPGLAKHKNAAGKDVVDNSKFTEVDMPLWGEEGPKPEHAESQGFLGDCYFLASLAAVCAANPGLIKSHITPHKQAKFHKVTFHKKDLLGNFHDVSYSVDNFLPTNLNGGLTYGRGGGGGMWVQLFEKAWAKHKGSYEDAEGGWGHDAMESLTGVRSEKHSCGSKNVIDKFRELQKAGKAVAVGTKKDKKEAEHGWTPGKFTKQGNVYTAQLDASLSFQSVIVRDASKGFTARDDSNNNMIQGTPAAAKAKLTEGTVNYQTGKVVLKFDAAAQPSDAVDLQVRWNNAGATYQEFGVVGGHEYRFVSVAEPDAVNLKNPWGHQHPKKPVTGPAFNEMFNELASNEVPGAAKPAAAKAAVKK